MASLLLIPDALIKKPSKATFLTWLFSHPLDFATYRGFMSKYALATGISFTRSDWQIARERSQSVRYALTQ
jgi:hypothetical protein